MKYRLWLILLGALALAALAMPPASHRFLFPWTRVFWNAIFLLAR